MSRTITLKEIVEFYQTVKSHQWVLPEQCVQAIANEKYGSGTKLGGVKFTSQIVSNFTDWFAPYDGFSNSPLLERCLDTEKIHQLVNPQDAAGNMIYHVYADDYFEGSGIVLYDDHAFWLQFFASLLALHPDHVFRFNNPTN